VDSGRHDMVAQCSVGGGQPKIGPLQYTYDVVVSFVGEVMVRAGCFTFATIPNKVYFVASSGWCGEGQR
jgi:hypothetical protein